MNDAELLRKYTRERSEEAFAELVSRYLDLVYSAALRQVGGDAHLAEDVAQTVFAALAKKAYRLPAGVVLGGWLYRHTCFVAWQTIRSERRRRLREEEVFQMNSQDATAEPNWQELAPFLDKAMQRLGETDRNAIVLRYYERHDLNTVGSALGVTEDAAKKRVSRALEKLRGYFNRRGLTLSAAALASLLGTKAVSAAPVGLKTGIAMQALHSSAVVGTGIGYWAWLFVKVRPLGLLAPTSLGLLALAAGAVLLASPWARGYDQVRVRLELSGTQGMKLTGHYDADGVRYSFAGVVPTNLTFSARRFSYSIKKASEPGELRGDLYLNDSSRGASSTSAAGWGVAGSLDFRGPMTRSVVTLTSPGEP